MAAYVTPLLLAVAAAMVSGLASRDGFDRFYALRVLAVGTALWGFRRQYSLWRWRCSYAAVGAGIAVAVPWILLAPAAGAAPDATAAALVAMAPGWATLWILCRLAGAVVTVPLAEESRSAAISPAGWSHVTSSGSPRAPVMARRTRVRARFRHVAQSHRRRDACRDRLRVVARRRGSLADAVVAHATTNALLAVWVLWTGSWSLW